MRCESVKKKKVRRSENWVKKVWRKGKNGNVGVAIGKAKYSDYRKYISEYLCSEGRPFLRSPSAVCSDPRGGSGKRPMSSLLIPSYWFWVWLCLLFMLLCALWIALSGTATSYSIEHNSAPWLMAETRNGLTVNIGKESMQHHWEGRKSK